MNNLDFMTVYWILLGIFAAGIVVFFAHRLYTAKHSEVTKKTAGKVFRLHGGIRNWKVLNNVAIGEGKDAVVADHLVIGPFGVIIACDLHQKGNVYGALADREWIVSTGKDEDGVKTRIPSPYHNAQLCVEQLRREFAKKKIYSVPVELMVPKTQKQGCYITGGGQYLFDMRELKAQLEKSRFEKDNGVNIEAVAALFNR